MITDLYIDKFKFKVRCHLHVQYSIDFLFVTPIIQKLSIFRVFLGQFYQFISLKENMLYLITFLLKPTVTCWNF